MGLWTRLSKRNNDVPVKVTIHDYTTPTPGHEVTLVKALSDATKVFLSGTGKGVKAGDIIVLKEHNGMLSSNVRYRVETVNYADKTWRAYGRIVITTKIASRGEFFVKKQ